MESVFKEYPAVYYELGDSFGMDMPNYHIHDQYELSFCTEGEILLDAGSTHVKLKAPFVRILRPYQVHLVTVAPDMHYVRTNLYFTERALDGIDRHHVNMDNIAPSDVTLIFPDEAQTAHLKLLFTAVTDCGRQDINPLLLAGLLRDIGRLTPESYPQRQTVKYQYICDIIKYICAQYMEPISTAELAVKHFISVSKLNRDFFRYTQTTVREFIIRIRLRNAAALLQAGTSVAETAHLCGFGDVSHFIRTFRKYYRTTPYQYRA